MKRIHAFAAVVAFAAASAAAQYPTKPIRVVVPFSAGGPTDAIARSVSRSLSQSFGQPVIVENKPGADGQIAAQTVFTSPPDGYTLYVTGSSASVALPALRKDLGFDPLQFTAVANIATVTFGLFVHPNVPARSVAELVAHLRANPDKLNYGVGANSEFMAATQLMKASGTRMVKIPFKGSAQAMPELVAGRIQVYFAPLSGERLGHVKDGRLRLIATVSPKRTAFTPDVPTMIEAGYPGVSVPGWNALVGPPGMSPDTANKLARAIAKAVEDSEVRVALERLLLEVTASTPEELRERMKSDHRLWSDFVREHGAES